MIKTEKTKKDIQALKQELIQDLDQFLFDEDSKAKALLEIDRLIKADLAHNEILLSIQKKVAPNKVEKVKQSVHILDLRPQEIPSVSKLTKYKENLKKVNLAKLKRTKPESIKFYYPVKEKKEFYLPSFRLSGVASKIIVFSLIMALILLPLRGLVLFGQINNDKDKVIDFGKQGLINLQTGVISASENSYEVAQNDFEKSLDNFHQAQGVLDEYHHWIINASSLMPIIGKPLSLSRNMLAVATNISEAATILNEKIQANENLTENLVIIDQQIKKTIPYLENAQEDLNNISSYDLPSDLRPYFDSLKTYLPGITENLKTLNEIFPVLISLLGHETEQRYLVLFQNNNELRASGGFIGSYALFDVYQGKIINLEIPRGGTYDLEAGQTFKIKAPQALSAINPYFNIWDANWWSDFPSSAKKVISFYENSGGGSVNGVLAINAEVLKELLVVLGPITLEEYGVTITSANIFDVLQEEVELNYKDETAPKAIIADLTPIILEKLLANQNQAEIVAILAKMLATKDIQIYSTNQATQAKISDLAWSGEMVEYNKDYLSVVNTNIGGGKTDNDIYQTIDHQVKINANGEIINTVRITRTNQGNDNNPFAGRDGGNVNYLRLYVPLGSEFVKAIGFDTLSNDYFNVANNDALADQDILKEEETMMIDSSSGTSIYNSLGKTVFANWSFLGPGETKTVSLEYKLPFKIKVADPLVNDWWQKIFKKDLNLDNYSLVVQSQSGVQNTIFNSSVLLPDNLKVVWNNASDESKMSVIDNLVTYSQELTRDQYFGFIMSTQ